MTERKKYERVVLKLSGEALSGEGGAGYAESRVRFVATEIAAAARMGARLGIVVGAGNLLRGTELAASGLAGKATADNMGMLATVMNGLVLNEILNSSGVPSICMSAIHMPSICEPFSRRAALAHLDSGAVIILAGGTGNPFCTTDTAAALRAAELGSQAILKATKVDGVYSADPKKVKNATRYDQLTFTEAIEKRLGVMDLTALSMCQDANIPVVVFDFGTAGNLVNAIQGKSVGTLVHP